MLRYASTCPRSPFNYSLRGRSPLTNKDALTIATFFFPQLQGKSNSKGDEFRTSLQNQVSKIQSKYRTWSKDFTLSDDYVLDPARKLFAAIEDEDLEEAHVYGKLLVVINNVYTALGDLANAVKYGEMA